MNASDFFGIQPRLCVEVGADVSAGDALFRDKTDPSITITSPGSGTVVDVKRGARRALRQVVVRLEESESQTSAFSPDHQGPITGLRREAVVESLCRSGLWSSIRSRPFGRVPQPSTVPSAIFVTAIDTLPLAADPQVVIQPRMHSFERGLRVLSRLTEGPVWLCTAPEWALGSPRAPNLRHAHFSGPHPAGLAGTHIHWLHHVRGGRIAWHVGYQDVIAMGRLFAENVLYFARVVAVGGEACRRPRLLRTRLGASLEELAGSEGHGDGPVQICSGSPLSARRPANDLPFLGRFDLQVWLTTAPREPGAFSWWWRGRGARSGRDLRGSQTGMLPLERFERLMQPGFLAVPLLRALVAGDIERALALGCLELTEDDLALCDWACPARSNYAGALRAALVRIEEER